MKWQTVPQELVDNVQQSRDRLRIKKPKVYAKLLKYLESEKNEEEFTLSLLDFAYDFGCNFRCSHCCAEAFNGTSSNRIMTLDEVKRVADQADDVGIFIINLIGGEPLIWKELPMVIQTIDPDRFHISMTTNGWLLTEKVTKQLVDLGVDKVGISIDSGFAEEHDAFRSKKGSFEKALEGAKFAVKAGLRTLISTVVTHQNIHSEGFIKLFEITKELNIGLDLQCATVSGGWQGRLDVLLDQKDAEFLETLRLQHPLLRRDVWTTPGSKGGCPAVTRSAYIIPSGDVLPCLFIHISLGNVFKEPLRDILKRGVKVDELREYSKLCLAGEDLNFINKYLSRTFNAKSLPLTFDEGFKESINPREIP